MQFVSLYRHRGFESISVGDISNWSPEALTDEVSSLLLPLLLPLLLLLILPLLLQRQLMSLLLRLLVLWCCIASVAAISVVFFIATSCLLHRKSGTPKKPKCGCYHFRLRRCFYFRCWFCPAPAAAAAAVVAAAEDGWSYRLGLLS